MSLRNIQQCPTCHGCVDIEHNVVQELGEIEIGYLYCEFCQIGWETLWQRVKGGDFELKIRATFSASKDAVKLGMFIQRMKDAVAA